MHSNLPLDCASTILDCLEHYAARQADRRAYTFLADGELDERVLTYGELQQRARQYGMHLRSKGYSNQAVLLLFPAGLDFIVAFFACAYAGAFSVPANLARNSHHFSRLKHIIQDCGAKAVLSTPTLTQVIHSGLAAAGLNEADIDVLHEPTNTLAIEETWPLPQPDQLAFLQYTSGSTGEPKGVMISHGQLMANERAIQQSVNMPEHLTGAGWLPQFHDMGLIGTTLQPLALGGHYVFMSPLHFLQKPLRWLQMMSSYQAAFSAAPNFALELCTKALQAEHIEVPQLGKLTTIFCGAEPVSIESVSKFEQRLAKAGLPNLTVKPCYGLAEATLMVSGGLAPSNARSLALNRDALAAGRVERHNSERNNTSPIAIACCGLPVQDHCVRIVNPDTLQVLDSGQVGEIWFSGGSVASGYWKKPSETEITFKARTACGQGPFMRTGDLGFLDNGALFVTGRIKELIIFRGRNIYPHDVESTLTQASPQLGHGLAAVFASDSETGPGVVAFIELPRRSATANLPAYAALASMLRTAVAQAHDLQLRDVYFIAHGKIPRTSSGKIQRRNCAALYASREIDIHPNTVYSTRIEHNLTPQS